MALVHCSLFTLDTEEPESAAGRMEPRQGLTARLLSGQPCVIIDVFLSRGVALVDVAEVVPCSNGMWALAAGLETVKSSSLSDVGLCYKVIESDRRCMGPEGIWSSPWSADVATLSVWPAFSAVITQRWRRLF